MAQQGAELPVKSLALHGMAFKSGTACSPPSQEGRHGSEKAAAGRTIDRGQATSQEVLVAWNDQTRDAQKKTPQGEAGGVFDLQTFCWLKPAQN